VPRLSTSYGRSANTTPAGDQCFFRNFFFSQTKENIGPGGQ